MEPPSPADLLVRLLDLERVAPERFRGEASGRGKRLFGGLVAAQAIVAAGRSVAGANLHSLHAYFLRPGRPGVPIDYDVELTKEGRNFHARTVRAAQEDETIFTMMTSFTRPEDGIAHQDPMPEAPPPEDLPDRDRLRGHRDWASQPVEIRSCDPMSGDEPLPARQRYWLRPRGALPEDPLLHVAVLVYASDRALMSTASRPHVGRGARRAASLDHSVWLHHAPRFDDWHLYTTESPVAENARALCTGAFFSRDGTRVASVAQEGLLRYAPTRR